MDKIQYKELGQYVEPVMEKNFDLSVKLSQGICNNKYFQNPRQVAVNSANDQIVRKGQFAYNKATTRNGDKISIAYREGEDCTVSSAYQVFRIKDENLLNPHYLLLWFKRPEFDRYARFKSHGSAHEFFDWEEMCKVMLPVPPIEEQRRIVSEYQTVEARIKNNEALIRKLEETAQAIYHHTFVEGIDEENLPEGWKMGKLEDIAIICSGKDHQDLPNGEIPIYGSGGLMRYGNSSLYEGESVLIPRKGTLNNIMYVNEAFWTVDTMFYTTMKVNNVALYLYYSINKIDFLAQDSGTTVPSNTSRELNQIDIVIPDNSILEKFNRKITIIHKNIKLIKDEQKSLATLLSLLTSKLA